MRSHTAPMPWTPAEFIRLSAAIDEGMSIAGIVALFPGRLRSSVRGAIGRHRASRRYAVALESGHKQRRRCLKCREPFISDGAHHRLCTPCRVVNARLDGAMDEPATIGCYT